MKQQSSKIPSVGDEAYVYDKNGNMIEDKYKKIQISYNYLNLPLQITYKENNFIHFVYSATGEKLQKIVTVEGKVQSKTDYVNGIEYKNDVLQRVAHTEGSLSRQDDDKFLQEYVLRDHLGNTRVTFTDTDNDGNVNEKDIKQINHFYAYGLNMEGNWNGAAGSNKYQYNGKEWNDDFGLGWNHHDWRFLDPAICRFVTIDRLPEEEEQEQLTPYQFAYNNPIRYDDPDGQCPTCIVGGLVGGLVEFGGQVLTNLSEGKSLEESVTDIDVADVVIAIAEGALTSGGSIVRRAVAKAVVSVVAEVAENTLDVKVKDKKLEVKANSVGDIAKNTAIGLTVGKLGDKIPVPKIVDKVKILNPPTPKQAVQQARKEGQKVTTQKRVAIEKSAKQSRKNGKEIKETVNKLPGDTAAEAAGEKAKRKTD